MSNEILRGKLLSLDGKLTLAVLALDPAVVNSGKLRDVVGEVRKTMDEDLAGSGLSAELSGVPVMQLEIRNAVERDRIVYNAPRLPWWLSDRHPVLPPDLLHDHRGGTTAAGNFARPWHARLARLPAHMFLNVMTPLIMVISFSDSMQLTYAARDRIWLDKASRCLADGDPCRGAGLRPDSCDRRPFLRRADLLEFGPHPKLR